jgi:hypothetical protein
MRFLIAIACLALTSFVSAQDEFESSYISDFDILGREAQSLPLQQKELEKQTIMLQPIVLMPKKRLAPTKTLNFDIDRAMAYRVSPKVSAENSRSVDVSFSPILNAKMRNILTSDLPHQVRVRTPQLQRTWSTVKSPQQYQAPVQQYQQQYQDPQQFTGLQNVQDMGFVGARASSGLRENIGSNQFQFVNEQVMSPQEYQFTSDNQYQSDMDNIQGARYQSFQ